MSVNRMSTRPMLRPKPESRSNNGITKKRLIQRTIGHPK